jgi:signal transduction histidine kinase
MGLRQRVILIVTVPALLATAVHGALRIQQEQHQLRGEYERNLTLTAKAIAISIENALRDRQWSDVGNLVTQMVEQQDVIDRIRLFDRDATIVFVSDPLKIADAVPVDELRRVIASGHQEESYTRKGHQSIISIIVPVRGRTGGIEGGVEVAALASGLDRRLNAAIVDVLVRLGLLLAVTIGLTAFTLQRQVLRPLARLADGIRRLGRGDADVSLAVDRRDELGEVAQQFNDMAGRLREARQALLTETERAIALEQQARQTSALSVAGKLAAAVAHEVGTPLNIISARAEYIMRGRPSDDPVRRDLQTIVTQIDRISRIITRLLDAVRPQAPKLEPTPIGQILGDVLPLLRFAARQRGVTLIESAPPPLPLVLADAAQLQQVLLNLVLNSLEATPHGGTVTISVPAAPREASDGIVIEVSDTGPGVAPDLRERIFETFFTTKPRGQGTGLGLAISRDIVRAHGGDITVSGAAGHGATFSIRLPAPPPEP